MPKNKLRNKDVALVSNKQYNCEPVVFFDLVKLTIISEKFRNCLPAECVICAAISSPAIRCAGMGNIKNAYLHSEFDRPNKVR